jgi:hypothetical protein
MRRNRTGLANYRRTSDAELKKQPLTPKGELCKYVFIISY